MPNSNAEALAARSWELARTGQKGPVTLALEFCKLQSCALSWDDVADRRMRAVKGLEAPGGKARDGENEGEHPV